MKGHAREAIQTATLHRGNTGHIGNLLAAGYKRRIRPRAPLFIGFETRRPRRPLANIKLNA